MYLIDKQYIIRFEVGKKPRKVTRLIEHRSACCLDVYAKLVGKNIGKSGFSQSRGAVKEDMVQCLITLTGSTYKYLQVFDHLFLPCEILKALWPEHFFKFFLYSSNLSGSGVEVGIAHEAKIIKSWELKVIAGI